jgi:hypothetical protein
MNAYIVKRSIEWDGVVGVWAVAAESEDLALDFIQDNENVGRYDLDADIIRNVTVDVNIISAQYL